MNLIQKKKKKKKIRIFPLLEMILCHFPHALYQFFIIFTDGNYFYGKHYIDTK